MTFTQLANYVENSFNPRRYTNVMVERTCQPYGGGSVEVTWSIHVGSTEHDKAETVSADSLEQVKALFDARWLGAANQNPDKESDRVDA